MPREPNKDAAARRIAESLMPGWEAVGIATGTAWRAGFAFDGNSPVTKVDETMPSMEELKAKYLGIGAADARGADGPRQDFSADGDTRLVTLRNGPLSKTVAVSTAAKKVIWSQG